MSLTLKTRPKYLKNLHISSKIRIVTVNVNGFRARENEIRKYLADKEECVLAVNDTRLSQNNANIAIPGYRMLREDKVCHGPMATAGGVAILVPQKWSCLRLNLTTKGDNFEAYDNAHIDYFG